MPKKHKPLPPKAPEEEEEEISTPISSQPFSEKPNSNKPTFHPNQTHKPHTASSSSAEEVEGEGEEGEGEGGEEEEEEEAEEEEIDREEDDEETEDSETEKPKYIATLSKPTQPTKQKEQEEEEDSDYEQDSASGSSSESSSQSPKSNKPISSKKIDRHPKSKKPQTNSDGAAPSSKKPGASHKGEKAGVESKQRAFFWCPEDEITLLKGMMEFAERGYSDASSDKDGFLRFINKLLTIKVTRRQLVGKIAHLKYKYKTELKKAREGKKPVFSNPHNKLKYQLSKKLWGENDPTLEDDGDDDDIEVENGNGVDTLNTVEKDGGNAKKRMSTRGRKCGGNVKRRQKNSQNDDVLLEEVDSEAVLYPHLNELLHWSGIVRVSGLSESDVKRAFQLMSPSQVKELDLQWRKLQLKERDIHMERLSLAYDLTKQFYDLVKSSEV